MTTHLKALKDIRENADYNIDLGDWDDATVQGAETSALEVLEILSGFHPDGLPYLR